MKSREFYFKIQLKLAVFSTRFCQVKHATFQMKTLEFFKSLSMSEILNIVCLALNIVF